MKLHTMEHLNLSSEYILSIFGLQITNTFFTSVIVSFLLGLFSLLFYFQIESKNNILSRIFRVLVYELLRLMDMVTNSRKMSKLVLPLIATFFLFIVTSNLLGLIPGFLGSFYVQTSSNKLPLLRSPNTDLSTTIALAVVSIFAVQYFSIRAIGIGKYISRFINLKSPVYFFLGIFEFFSEFIKIISFSVRLFGNIFAGEVLLLVIAFLVPYILPVPFMILELFVGVMQAFIFAILTLTFIKTSTLRA